MSRRYSLAVDREMEAHTLTSLAVDGFLKELGLKESDRYLLEDHIEFRDAEPGITILRENSPDVSEFILRNDPQCWKIGTNYTIFFWVSPQDVCLLYILNGSVSVLQQNIGFPGSKSPSSEVITKLNPLIKAKIMNTE